YLVLRESASHAELLHLRNTAELIGALHTAGVFAEDERDALEQAHALYLAEGLACTLDRRKRIVRQTEQIAGARQQVTGVLLRQGLDFGTDER
ncbi:hypothetical protein MRO49_24945, partial [Escherichia coli]|uniref:hypothetical protein n=1 Tax=Escherichia coli TaxID=562 RepID=UPI0021148AC3